MFPNDLQLEAMKTDTVETFLNVSINIRRSYMRYPTFSFRRICCSKFQNLCLYITGYLQIGTHLNIHSFQLEVRAGFRHFTASFQ